MAHRDRLSPLDAWFWEVEGPADHQHIGSVAILEGPEPPFGEIRHRAAEVMPTIPRARQRCAPSPFGLARPAWVEVEFDLDYHLRRTALPAPGGDEELTTLVGRVMSQPLDRTRPLWELWVVSGLSGGRWAIVNKIHHCVVDGVAGVQLLLALYDLTPEPTPAPRDLAVIDTAPTGGIAAFVDALRAFVDGPVDGLRRGVDGLREPRRTARSAVRVARGLLQLLPTMLPTEDHGLNGRIGSHRTYALARASLEQVTEVRRATGVSFNDVGLAAVSCGFAELLRARGVSLAEDDRIRTLVPVSVRDERAREVADNRVSVLLADLPIGVRDPMERLRRIHRETSHLKESREADAGVALVAFLAALPAPLVGAGTRLAGSALDRLVQHTITTVTTNVPGPPVPIYALGRRVLELFPYVLVGEGLTTGVAMMSYDGQLAFGVTGDLDASPDVEVLAAGIEAGMAELVDAVHRASPAVVDGHVRGGRAR